MTNNNQQANCQYVYISVNNKIFTISFKAFPLPIFAAKYFIKIND